MDRQSEDQRSLLRPRVPRSSNLTEEDRLHCLFSVTPGHGRAGSTPPPAPRQSARPSAKRVQAPPLHESHAAPALRAASAPHPGLSACTALCRVSRSVPRALPVGHIEALRRRPHIWRGDKIMSTDRLTEGDLRQLTGTESIGIATP
jgi:hypothetical protein